MDKIIMHIDLDTFFVSVERLYNPDLQGKAVIVGGEDKGVVCSCSYEARTFGVRSGMSIQRAKKLCPTGIFLRGKFHLYGQYSKRVRAIVQQMVPSFEQASVDEYYIDLTGTDTYLGALKLATNLRNQIILQTGLPVSFALASTKTIAKIGTGLAKPNGYLYIPAGEEREFLSKLPVEKIPMVGKKATLYLNTKGFFTIKDLYEQDLSALTQKLGRLGYDIWRKIHGNERSRVSEERDPKSFSFDRTFFEEHQNWDKCLTTIAYQCGKLGSQLRKYHKKTRLVTIKIRYKGFETFTFQRPIAATSDESSFVQLARRIFLDHVDKKRLVRLIGVKVSNFEEENAQLSLFEQTDTKKEKLLIAKDLLKKKFSGISQGFANSLEGSSPAD